MAASLMVAFSPNISRLRLVTNIWLFSAATSSTILPLLNLGERPDEQRSYIDIDWCRCLQ